MNKTGIHTAFDIRRETCLLNLRARWNEHQDQHLISQFLYNNIIFRAVICNAFVHILFNPFSVYYSLHIP